MNTEKSAIDTIALTHYSELRQRTMLIGVNCMAENAGRGYASIGDRTINPYKNYEDVKDAAEYCWATAIEYCNELGQLLNSIHGFSYDKLYWRTVLLHWATVFVENVYDRYLRLKCVREHYPDAVIEIPRLKSYGILYNMTVNTWKYAFIHQPNIKIYSFLIERMGLSERRKHIDAAMTEISKSETFKEMVLRWMKHLYRTVNFHSGSTLFLWHSVRSHRIFGLAAGMGWFQWGSPLLKDDGFNGERIDRARLVLRHTGEEFKDILRDITGVALPVSLFEEFRERREIALSFINKKRLKTVLIAQNIEIYDTERILAAEVKRRGGQVIGIQHGGGYGNFVNCMAERVERSIFDYFITWGWEDKSLCPTIPLPSPYLSILMDTHKKKSDDIIYIGTHGALYMFCYQSYYIPEYVHNKYYNLKKIFFNGLCAMARKRLLYRPYPHEYGWNEKARVRDIMPEVRFSGSYKAILEIRHCSLVVIDHPATSLLEALRMNVPTILFWDDAQCPMRSEAQPYFQLLVDAGILYYDASRAARKVNEIFNDPMKWWRDEKVQSARLKFCDRFASARKDWQKIWIKEVGKILSKP